MSDTSIEDQIRMPSYIRHQTSGTGVPVRHPSQSNERDMRPWHCVGAEKNLPGEVSCLWNERNSASRLGTRSACPQKPQLPYTMNSAVNQFACGSAARISKPWFFSVSEICSFRGSPQFGQNFFQFWGICCPKSLSMSVRTLSSDGLDFTLSPRWWLFLG